MELPEIGLGEVVTYAFTGVIVFVYVMTALERATITDNMLRMTDMMFGFVIGRIATMPGPQDR